MKLLNTFPTILLSAVMWLGFGCARSAGQGAGLISLEQDNATYNEQLTFHFKNTTENSLAIITSGCSIKEDQYLPSFVIEKQGKKEWENAGGPICIEIVTPPIKLSPGESYTVSIPVSMGLDTSAAGGQFRYVFDLRRENDGRYPAESKIAKAMRTSPGLKIVSDN